MGAGIRPSFKHYRPTIVEISTSAFIHNLSCIKKRLKKITRLLLVVKANAYGHGACELSEIAVMHGVHYLGVSSIEEGICLRRQGIKKPILVLGSHYPFSSYSALVQARLIPTIASRESADALCAVLKKVKKSIVYHFKVDTGMGRIGVAPAKACEIIRNIVRYPYMQLEGVYTHCASADTDVKYTLHQLALLHEVKKNISRIGIKVPVYHAANSAATARFPSSHLDMVRIGLAAYGLKPQRNNNYFTDLKPVLSWKTKVVFLKWVSKHTSISYGNAFITKHAAKVATLPVGYADGYNRLLSNNADVLIQGTRCPVIGRVTMDMIMVDVTDIAGVRIGDDAVLIGTQGNEVITVEEIAQRCQTISYEIVCNISSRVPRVYR